MEMFLLLLLSAVCLFWMFSYLVFSERTAINKKAENLFFIFSLFFLFSAFANPSAGCRLMLHFTIFAQTTSLLITPFILLYTGSFQPLYKKTALLVLCFIIPAVHLVTGIQTVYIAGYWDALDVMRDIYAQSSLSFGFSDNRALFIFYLCVTYVFKSYLVVEFLCFSIFFASAVINGSVRPREVLGYLFSHKKSTSFSIQYTLLFPIILITVLSLIKCGGFCYCSLTCMFVVTVLFVVLFSIMAVAGLGDAGSMKTFAESRKALKLGSNVQHDSSSLSGSVAPIAATGDFQMKGLYRVEAENDSGLYDEIIGLFDQKVVNEHMFLKQGLALTEVADALRVDRDVLADCIVDRYGMSFLNYVNKLRVEFAQQYILQNEGATQKDIAYSCGFTSASAFNTAFSKVTGVTPKIWKDRYTNQSGTN